MTSRIFRSLAFVLLLFAGSPAFAATDNPDEGLYAPLPPPGSAFVRFINLEREEMTPSLNGKTYDAQASMAVTPYYVVPKGEVKLSYNGVTHEHEAVEGKFYTAVLAEKAAVLEDQANDNRAKALISFYNLTSAESLELKTADGSVSIVEAQPVSGSGHREINPVKIGLSVYVGEEQKTVLDPVALQRGMAYSLFTVDGEEGVQTLWVESATDTEK